MKNAFIYMFNDNKYLKKASIYAGFVLVANLLLNFSQSMRGSGIGFLLLILSYIALFIPSGYGITCVKAILTQNENVVLPAINLKKNFILGFKLFIAGTLLGLAIGGVCIAFCILFGIIGAFVIPSGLSRETIGLLFLIPFAILTLIILITYLIYGLAMSVIFAKKEFYTVFFKFGFANKLISQDKKQYFCALGIYILAFIALMIITFIPLIMLKSLGNIGIIINSLIQSLISAYTIFVFSYIIAKSTRAEILDEN